jgi:hypothetical protein
MILRLNRSCVVAEVGRYEPANGMAVRFDLNVPLVKRF